jgi:hypothetical protein
VTADVGFFGGMEFELSASALHDVVLISDMLKYILKTNAFSLCNFTLAFCGDMLFIILCIVILFKLFHLRTKGA